MARSDIQSDNLDHLYVYLSITIIVYSIGTLFWSSSIKRVSVDQSINGKLIGAQIHQTGNLCISESPAPDTNLIQLTYKSIRSQRRLGIFSNPQWLGTCIIWVRGGS